MVGRRALTKRQKKGEKSAWRGKWENTVQLHSTDSSVRKETHVVSVLIEHLETDAIRDKKDNRFLLHQKRRHRVTERNRQKVQASEEKVVLQQEARFRAEISLGESLRTRHVIFGTFPCVSIARLNQDANVAKNAESDTLRLTGSPAKSRRNVLKESIKLGFVSQDSHPNKSILRKEGNWHQITHRQILQGHVAPHQNSGKRGSIARRHSKMRTS